MGRILDSLIGQEAALKNLRGLSGAQKFPSSLILVGPEGIGKGLVALGWVQEIFCETKTKNSACGFCPSCLQIEKENFAELLIVRPEKKSIKIEVIHELLSKLSLQALKSQRFVIIFDAHLLNQNATNALLKTLEEPPAKTHFIMTAPSEKLLLPTVRSRSHILHFKRLTDLQVASWAQRESRTCPGWVLEIAQGRLDLLVQLQTAEARAAYDRLLQLVKTVETSNFFAAQESLKEIVSDKESQTLWSPILAAIYKQGAAASPSEEDFGFLKSISRDQLLQKSAAALKLESDLRAHRDPQLLLEQFFLRTYGIH